MVEIKNSLYKMAAPSTQSLHADAHLRATADVTAPINVSTTFEYAKDKMDGLNYGIDQRYVYTSAGTPTLTKVEATLSTLTDGHAVVYCSGVSAAFSVLIEHRPKKIALGQCFFGINDIVKQYQQLVPGVQIVGINCSFDKVDLVWLESPLNPTGEVMDISSYALRAHAAGALLVVDSTLAPPPLSYPFRQGADIVVHSATKYLGGHNDLLAGVVVTKSAKSADSLRNSRAVLGTIAGSLECWLLLRSLRTLFIRVQQQSQTTARLVAFLENARRMAVATPCHTPSEQEYKLGHRISTVSHASLQLCAANCSFIETQHPHGFGAVFAIRFACKGSALFVARHLSLHRFATSLGGVESLVEWCHGWNSSAYPTLLRISVGLESFDDMAKDWTQTLLALNDYMVAKAKI
ncbi:hypothetical protein IWW36_002537 [Coemansia brasiliensis]|uniref:Cystathionine gamma-synthase n=1 Tax=Coemansia brasiliensis TaxID=2650707 RepID=A0A9W8IBS4_9FUNG|nr:hypothetical protein IWW36_002537 [Coemansia brasiliensis]